MVRAKECADHITKWIAQYVEESKVQTTVIGVSGGIDSALSSTLAARTGLPTTVVEMPIHQAESQVSRAQEHIAWLQANFPNVQAERVDLTPVFERFREVLPQPTFEEDVFLALANSRARLRMTTLYYLAALQSGIVVGTGNKVEDFGVGFYTKYGDGGVDISPIADLTKTEVFQIAKELGVVQSILEAAPTDGLWGDDRSDEDQLGATYPELEWAMDQDAKGKTAEDFTGREKEVMGIYLKLNRQNQHKMRPIPVCEIPQELRVG